MFNKFTKILVIFYNPEKIMSKTQHFQQILIVTTNTLRDNIFKYFHCDIFNYLQTIFIE